MQMGRTIGIGIAAAVIGGSMLSAGASAASFNCDKASLPDEIAICAHRDLNDADVEMATRYTMLLQLLPMGSAGSLRDDQKVWLAWRKACGGDIACLHTAYQDRITALKAAFQRVVARGPF